MIVKLLYIFFDTARQPYNVDEFSLEHFCSSQTPPCKRNECRVATQIVAGLYPLNYSKFLIPAYQPLTEDERKKLINTHQLYLTYLIRKLCNDNTKIIGEYNVNDVVLDVNDTEYALLCDIGSAFAECYLTEAHIPLDESLSACFVFDNGVDIELDMYWLECIYPSLMPSLYLDGDSPAATAAAAAAAAEATIVQQQQQRRRIQIEDDPKLRELKEIGVHIDKLFWDKPSLQKAIIRQEDIIKMTPADLGGEFAAFTADSNIAKIFSQSAASSSVAAEKDRMTTVEKLSSVAAAAMAAATAGTLANLTGGGGADNSVDMDNTDDVRSRAAAVAGTAAAAATSCGSVDEALKLAVNQKLNL